MFKKGWLGRALGAALGGLIAGGPLGAASAFFASAAMSIDWGFGSRPTHIEGELSYWADRYMVPYFEKMLRWNSGITNLTNNVLKEFNDQMAELYAYKAYWEFNALKASGDELILSEAKAEALGEFISKLHESWFEYFPSEEYGYSLYSVSFDPRRYDIVANEVLDWSGATKIVAEKFVLAYEKPSTGVGTIKTGGGTTTGGGGTIKTGGGTTTGGGGTIKTGGGTTTGGGGTIKTGGGTTTGGGSQTTTGGGTIKTPDINPIEGEYPTSPEPTVHIPTIENKSNKLLTYLGIAAIGYLVLKK